VKKAIDPDVRLNNGKFLWWNWFIGNVFDGVSS